MLEQHNTSKPAINNERKAKQIRLKKVVAYLRENTASATMTSETLGIPQKSFTRLKRKLELAGYLWVVEQKPCKATGRMVQYLTTDPEKAAQITAQLSLFPKQER